MTQTEVSRSYREAAIRGASSVECTIMLYDIVIADLRKAIRNLNTGDIEGRTGALVHCLNVLEALQGTLQMETGGEAAQHLYRFYSLARAKILEGQIKCNARLFEEIVRSMLQVRALWENVKQQCEPLAASEPWKVLAGDEPSASGAWSA
jgi:flagellar protein FliS